MPERHFHSPPPVIIAGMHRSGTSLVAGLLQRAGVDLGERLIRADAWNRHGYHEDAELVGFHGRIFRSLLPRGARGHADWGWTETGTLDLTGLHRFRPAALRLAAERAARSPRWGFKDPRTTLLLDFWHACVPDARFVLVYRAPWLVADSMQRVEADLFRRHPEYSIPIWTLYNRGVLDFYRRNRDRAVLLNVDALPGALDALRGLLSERCSLDCAAVNLRAGFDAALLAQGPADDPRATFTRIAYPESTRLHAELEAAADLPAAAACAPRRSVVLRPPTSPPALSVIIPTHNDAVFLLDALASVERAGLRDTEVIVVDDGTSDPDAKRILDSLVAAGTRLLRKPNRGLAAARNAGIAAAQGRYLLPLDADNRLLPGFAEAARAILDANPAIGIVHSPWRLFGAQSGRIEAPPFCIKRMAYGNAIDACAVFRRSVWADLGGYDEAMSGLEDWEFWLHAHAQGWKFQLLPEPGFEYRVRPNSLVARSNRFGIRHHLRHRILQRHPELLRSQLPPPLRRVSAGFARLLPNWAGRCCGSLITRCWWHVAWELVHFRSTCSGQRSNARPAR